MIHLSLLLAASGLLSPLQADSPTTPSSLLAPGTDSEAAAAMSADGFSLTRVDDVLWGLGNDYKARFGPGLVEVTPALGAAAERNYPVHFELESIRSGEQVLWVPTRFEDPTHAGNSASAPRGEGVIERFEITPDGIDYQLELPDFLASAENLLVTGKVTSDLIAGADGRSLRFGEDVPVRLKAREGSTAHLSQGAVQVAPVGGTAASSVNILGFMFQVSTAGTSSNADVAYNSNWDSYFIVWVEQFSGVDLDVRGRIYSGNQLSVFIHPLEIDAATLSVDPAVGSVEASGMFLVAWSQNTGIFTPTDLVARSASANPNAFTMSSAVTLQSTSNSEIDADLASESGPLQSALLMVWGDSGGTVRRARVAVPALPALPFIESAGTLAPSGSYTDSLPRLSPGGGESGRHLAVWQRLQGSGQHDVMTRMLDRAGNPVTQVVSLTLSSGLEETRPAVAGDGERFLVVYSSVAPGGSPHVMAGREVKYAGLLNVGPELNLWALASQHSLSVGYTGYEFVVQSQPDNSYTTVHAFDPFTFERAQIIGFGEDGGIDEQPSLATVFSGTGQPNPKGLFTYSQKDATGESVHAALINGSLGRTNFGFGCGAGEFLSGVPKLDTTLTFRLEEATPGSGYILALGFGLLGLDCGPCSILPDFTLPASAGFTSPAGDAQLAVDLPSNPSFEGLEFYAQWLVFNGGPCPDFGLSTTNAVQFTLL